MAQLLGRVALGAPAPALRRRDGVRAALLPAAPAAAAASRAAASLRGVSSQAPLRAGARLRSRRAGKHAGNSAAVAALDSGAWRPAGVAAAPGTRGVALNC